MAKAKFEIYKDVAGKFRFRLRAPNNKIVAVGEAYGTKDGCLSGIYAIRRYSHADVEDLTTVEIPQEEEVALEEIIEETKVLLNKRPNEAKKGSAVKFTGKLMSGKKGIAGATIVIYESDRSFMHDDYLTMGETSEDGSFSIEWKAEERDWWDNTVEVYAAFRGAGVFKPSKSEKHIIRIT